MGARTRVNLSDFSVGVNTQDTFVLPPYFPRNFLMLQNVGASSCAVSFNGKAASTNANGSIMLPANSSIIKFQKNVPQNAIHARSSGNTFLIVQSDDVIPSGVPFWVLNLGGVLPDFDFEFMNARYWQNNSVIVDPTGATILTVTRATSGTNLVPTSASGFAFTTFGANVARITSGLGLLSEEARTNNLLNSTVPVTQTTASLANGTYTLWVNGSGSATSSAGTAVGAGFGAATQGSPNIFTISTPGTVVVTVAGSLNAFQLELGSYGTSLIVTAGVTASRALDTIVLARPPVFGSAFTMFAQGTTEIAINTAQSPQIMNFIDTGGTNESDLLLVRTSGAMADRLILGGATQYNNSIDAVNHIGASVKSAFALAPGDQMPAAGGTLGIAHTTNPIFTPTIVGLGPWNGYIERVAGWANTRLSNSILQTITT